MNWRKIFHNLVQVLIELFTLQIMFIYNHISFAHPIYNKLYHKQMELYISGPPECYNRMHLEGRKVVKTDHMS